jgi:hypothetical protein
VRDTVLQRLPERMTAIGPLPEHTRLSALRRLFRPEDQLGFAS